MQPMANKPPPIPVVLELAPLPRDQIGPFLLLGVDKTVKKEQIEANWAQRVIWARKNIIKTPLEDVNWAKEVILDPVRRMRADAASLNLDATDGSLRRLVERYTGAQSSEKCLPLDVEKSLADYVPEVAVPDPETVRSAIVVPDVPLESPAVGRLLEALAGQPLDPWDLPLPDED
jgi:hypothetical protein